MKIVYSPGATPLDPNETSELIPQYITTQNELNELEGKNIEDALKWVKAKKRSDVLNISFVLKLHERMFKDVWKWAGKQRQSEKSIGVLKEQIIPKLDQLLKNTQYSVENKTYSLDEVAARFHHGLVAIHPFPNGNGRHARLMTDVFLISHDQKPFTWGSVRNAESIDVEGKIRNEYVKALKLADNGKFELLLEFVRS